MARLISFAPSLLITPAIVLWTTLASASPITFTNSTFETGDFTGWTVTVAGDPRGATPSVTSFDTLLGTDSLAATAPYFPGLGNFGGYNLNLIQTLTLPTDMFLTVSADVALDTADTNIFAAFAPIFSGATFGSGQPSLQMFPPATGTLRAGVKGILFAPAGTYDIGFRILISTSGPLGSVGGRAYLDNALLSASTTPPSGPPVSECGSPGGTFGCIPPTTPIPEPSTLLLLGTGLAALAYRRRRKP